MFFKKSDGGNVYKISAEDKMTNAAIYQQEAVKKLQNNELNSYESEFVEQIKNYSKKDLRNLTSKQFLFLRKIAERN